MADDEEVLPDEASIGAPGEGTEGSDTGEADDSEGDLSAVESDAATGENSGTQHGREAEESDETERPVLSRGETRFQKLANENARIREELAQARREREADRQARQAQEQQFTEQQWLDRWNVMTPEEKATELYYRGQQEIQALRGQFGAELQVMRDQATYEAKASINPLYARHQDEVERIFQGIRSQGQFLGREAILERIVGRKAIASASKDTAKARKAGQKKIEAQTTRPSSNKGDAASSRGKSGDTAEKRLAGVEI